MCAHRVDHWMCAPSGPLDVCICITTTCRHPRAHRKRYIRRGPLDVATSGGPPVATGGNPDATTFGGPPDVQVACVRGLDRAITQVINACLYLPI